MMRRISPSTACMVASETFLCVVIERPRNTFALVSAVNHRSELVAHAPLGHLRRHFGGALKSLTHRWASVS
jgi:hypothetical protein